ncbi:MAG: hypothetical protein RIB98_14935 [Acidimicrobiales bacterium]
MDRGFRYGRIDVCGLRHVGGDLSGDTDFVAVEVKPEGRAFGTSAGQAAGYSVYADRCYLAVVKTSEGFTTDEIAIADSLGVGLFELRRAGRGARVVRERLSAPKREPIRRLRLQYLDQLGFGQCAICESPFKRGDHRQGSWGENVTRQKLQKAVQAEKGYMWWLDRAAEDLDDKRDGTFLRRYLCPDCTSGLFGEILP